MKSLNAAACNMHAQFAAWENGNWIANSRTLASWISGLSCHFICCNVVVVIIFFFFLWLRTDTVLTIYGNLEKIKEKNWWLLMKAVKLHPKPSAVLVANGDYGEDSFLWKGLLNIKSVNHSSLCVCVCKRNCGQECKYVVLPNTVNKMVIKQILCLNFYHIAWKNMLFSLPREWWSIKSPTFLVIEKWKQRKIGFWFTCAYI